MVFAISFFSAFSFRLSRLLCFLFAYFLCFFLSPFSVFFFFLPEPSGEAARRAAKDCHGIKKSGRLYLDPITAWTKRSGKHKCPKNPK